MNTVDSTDNQVRYAARAELKSSNGKPSNLRFGNIAQPRIAVPVRIRDLNMTSDAAAAGRDDI